MNWIPTRPETAQLALENDMRFRGRAFGAQRCAVGEVCFNTGMSGYQEVLTDPSYAGQIVVMTAPQMGNYGITPFDEESARPQVAGLVVRSLSRPSSWRSVETLHAYLERYDIPGLYDIDTRALTRVLRSRGAQRGAIGVETDADELVEMARGWPGLEGRDLAAVVTCAKPYTLQPRAHGEAAADLRQAAYAAAARVRADGHGLHILVYDFGVKRNILERLTARGCRVTVVPAQFSAADALSLEPHGVLLSNGPGDPQAVDYAIPNVRALIGRLPLFGICLGHQILGLALGGRSFKLKFGHRGVNHPVHDRISGKVRITSQNHGFALDAASIQNADVEITEISLNDGTVEAMQHRSLPVFSVQYHPEASPGPHDNDAHFDRFLNLVAAHAGREPTPAVSAPRGAAGGEDAAA